MRFKNASPHRRVWNHLTNAARGTTLELAPGEEAEVEVPRGFADEHLVPVSNKPPAKSAAPEKE